jgi:CHAT domain-containing protein
MARCDVKALIGAVPIPYADTWTDLPSTLEEASAVASCLPPTARVAIPDGEDALHGLDYGIRAATLLARLPDAMILHLACHGLQDANNPLKSGFVMRDRLLMIEELMLVPLPRAFLAFLSACETAKGDKVSRPCDEISALRMLLLIGPHRRISQTRSSTLRPLCSSLASRVLSPHCGQ